MGHMSWKDLIQNKDNDALLSAWVFDSADKKLSVDIEQKINENVEASFQDFLSFNDADVGDINNKIEKKWYEKDFNERLDWDVKRVLDIEKNKEVNENTENVSDTLKALTFEIDLTSLAQEISDQKERTKEKVKAKLWKEEFDLYLFSGLNDKKDEVLSAINNWNYTKKSDIINFLKEWKVKEIQAILLKEDPAALPKYGDDTKFGQETFDALKKYISNNKLKGWIADGSTTVESWATDSWTMTNAVSGDGTTWGWSSSSSNNATNSSTETTTYPSNAEVWLNVYGWKDAYKWKIWSDVELAKWFPVWAKVETMPAGKKIKLEKWILKYSVSTKEETFRLKVSDKNWKAIYNNVVSIGSLDSWLMDENVRNPLSLTPYQNIFKNRLEKNIFIFSNEKKSDSIRDAYLRQSKKMFLPNAKINYNGKEYDVDSFLNEMKWSKNKKYIQNVDFVQDGVERDMDGSHPRWKIKNVEFGDNPVVMNESNNQVEINNNWKLDEFASIMAWIKNNNSHEEIKNSIVTEIIGKRKEYVKLDEEYIKLTLDTTPVSMKRKTDIKERQKEIKQLVHSLLVEEARYELANYLHNNPERLNKKLNSKCEFYIDSEYITREEFIKKLEKWKINPAKCELIWLDVTWDNENETYFTDIYQPNKDWAINSLTITDDPDFMKSKKLTKNEQIQYRAEWYVGLETKDLLFDVDTERRALKHILWIKWLFGRGGVDDEMSIATEDYNTNNPVFKERAHLRKLKRILMRLINDENLNIKSAFEEVNKAYEKWHNVDLGNKDLNKLLKMYTIYRDNSDWMIAGGDYFQKAMWLLDNYFIKDIKGFDDDNSVLDIYANEHIGRVEWLIDPDKQKKAVRKLFKGEYFGNMENFPSFKNSSELRKLKRIIKKIDLADVFQGGELAGGKYEDFSKLYSIYKENKKIDKRDDNGFIVVMEWEWSEYYNAVFDFLVWVWEWKQNIVEAVNSMKVLEDGISTTLANSNETIRYSTVEEKQFVLALADLNSDGRNDFGDRGIRMWLEIKNIWKSVAVDEEFVGLESENQVSDTVYGNLVEFAKYYMEKTGQYNLLSDLNSIGWVENMVTEIQTNPGLLNSLQNMLVDSPIPMDYILRYGKDASEKYLESDKADILSKVLTGKVTIDWLDQKLDKEIQNLVKQGLDIEKIPEIRSVLKPMFYGAIINNGGVNHEWVWAGLTLNTSKIWSFSLNLWAADVPWQWMSYGITMSWAKSVALSKSGKTTLDIRSSVGTTALFVPIASQYVWISRVLNANNWKHSLRQRGSIKSISIWANVSVVPWSLSRGVSAKLSLDKLAKINSEYKNIKEKLSNSNGILATVLSGIHMSSDRTDVISALEINLAKKIKGKDLWKLNKSDRLSVAKAAENLFQWISYYDLQWTLDINDPRLTTIVNDMSDNYALQWKNQAVNWVSNISIASVWVGVQFLSGFVPIPSIVDIDWNKNTYSKETPESVANYHAQLSTWAGMMNVKWKKWAEFLNEDGKITNNAVEYLNAKMSIAHPDIDVSDLDISISEYSMSTAHAHNTSWSQNALRIPKDLCKYVNINISSDVLANVNAYVWDGNIWEKGVEYIEVPLNAKIALLDYSRTNAGKFNLIIWDTKAEMDDLRVGPNLDVDDLDGDPTVLKNKNRLYMEEQDINKELQNLWSIDLDDRWAIETVDHPISKCEKAENGMVVFDLKPWMTAACVDMWWVNSVLALDKINNKLILPQVGTLSMYSRLDSNKNRIYEMYYSSSPSDKLDINFDVEWYMKSSTNWVPGTPATIGGTSWNLYKKDFTKIDMFDRYDSLDRAFDNVEDELSKMDWKGNSAEYILFMNESFEAGIDNVLDNTDYEKAFEALKKILNWELKNSKFDMLRKEMNNNPSTQEKLMIVDRFKAIFSYHIDLELTDTQKGRKWYMRLLWYDKKTKYPLNNSYKESILKKLDNSDYGREEQKNLFGMTAFYRLWMGDTWRSYSMTQMWSTNVLWWHMETIVDWDLQNTKERFWNNLDKSNPHKDVFVDSLVEKIGESFVTKAFIEKNLQKLLNWEQIDISDENGINKKIELDLDYVFYLLWECANESIWAELKWVKIFEKIKDEDGDGKPDSEETVRWEVEWGGDQISIDSKTENLTGGIYANGVDSLQQHQRAGKGSFWVGVAAAVEKETPEEYVPDGEANANNGWNDSGADNGWNDDWWSNGGTDEDGGWSTYWDSTNW